MPVVQAERVDHADLNDDFDIIALFNVHTDTEEAAAETVAYIAPGSLVFREGHIPDHERAIRRMTLYDRATASRLQQGNYGGMGLVAVSAVLADTLRAPDHIRYNHAELSYLYDKNCLIYLADYVNTADDDLSQYDAYLNSEPEVFEALEQAANLEEACMVINSLWRWFTARREYMGLRDDTGTEVIVDTLQIMRARKQLQLARAADGRIQVYIIRGLGHRQSFARRLRAKGLRLQNIALADQREYHPYDNVAFATTVTEAEFKAAALHQFMELQIAIED